MGKSTINGHFQKQTVSLPEGRAIDSANHVRFSHNMTSQVPATPASKMARFSSVTSIEPPEPDGTGRSVEPIGIPVL
jgi:hypothetical protein